MYQHFYYSIFIWRSACFGRHTAHHQGPKTALAASGFSYVEGCWTCSWWTFSGTCCVYISRIENPTRCHSVSKFYFIFIWSSTCFRRHTAHHQEPKTVLAASGFAYVEGCWTCSCWTADCTFLYSTWQRPATTRPTALHACKTRGC